MANKNDMSGRSAEPHEIYKVARAGIKIYPTNVGQRIYIEVENNGRKTRYDKHVTPAEVNDALAKTTIYFYNKIIESENGNPKPAANKGNSNP